jgi:hypothetical protein
VAKVRPRSSILNSQDFVILSEAKDLLLALSTASLERRADMYVSTLEDFVKAMGGEQKLTAKFPEGTVEISQFEDVKKATARAQPWARCEETS